MFKEQLLTWPWSEQGTDLRRKIHGETRVAVTYFKHQFQIRAPELPGPFLRYRMPPHNVTSGSTLV
jgi:hypothetical protein